MTDTARLIRTLEDSGLRRQAADAIASALEEQRRRSSGGVPPWALILVAGLMAGMIGFLATVALEHREHLAKNSERLARLEEGQKALKKGQQALKEGQQEILRRLRAGNSAPQAGLRTGPAGFGCIHPGERLGFGKSVPRAVAAGTRAGGFHAVPGTGPACGLADSAFVCMVGPDVFRMPGARA